MTCCVRPRYAYLLQWRCLSSSACCVIAVSMQQLASAGRWHGWMRMCGCRRTMPLPCTQQQQQQQHWPDRQACEHCTNGALSGDSAHATCSVFPSVSAAVSSPSRSSQSLDQTGGPQPPPGMFYGKSQLVARSVCNVAAADADDNVTSAEYRSGIYLPRNQRVGPPSAGTDPVRDIRL